MNRPKALLHAIPASHSRDTYCAHGTSFQNPLDSETREQPSFLMEIASEVDKPHKRAITKILMNFVAFHLGRDEALAPQWRFLRRYVRTGESEI